MGILLLVVACACWWVVSVSWQPSHSSWCIASK
jgi:hypothetical protein